MRFLEDWRLGLDGLGSHLGGFEASWKHFGSISDEPKLPCCSKLLPAAPRLLQAAPGAPRPLPGCHQIVPGTPKV